MLTISGCSNYQALLAIAGLLVAKCRDFPTDDIAVIMADLLEEIIHKSIRHLPIDPGPELVP